MSERRKVGLYLSLKLWKQIRVEALDREMSASKLVELAVGQWLAPKGPWQNQAEIAFRAGWTYGHQSILTPEESWTAHQTGTIPPVPLMPKKGGRPKKLKPGRRV